MTSKQHIVYCPPDTQQVKQFAREICCSLAQSGNTAYSNPEVVSGLADCLNFLGQLLAKLINQGHYDLLDKPQQ